MAITSYCFAELVRGLTPMVRDGVTNVVYQLGERGFAPRKLGHDVVGVALSRRTEVATTRFPSRATSSTTSCSSAGPPKTARISGSSARSVLRTNMCTRKPPIG